MCPNEAVPTRGAGVVVVEDAMGPADDRERPVRRGGGRVVVAAAGPPTVRRFLAPRGRCADRDGRGLPGSVGGRERVEGGGPVPGVVDVVAIRSTGQRPRQMGGWAARGELEAVRWPGQPRLGALLVSAGHGLRQPDPLGVTRPKRYGRI